MASIGTLDASSLDDAIAKMRVELRQMDAPLLQAQEISQKGAVHAIQHLQRIGVTPKNAEMMMDSLRRVSALVSEECRRRGLAVVDVSDG